MNTLWLVLLGPTLGALINGLWPAKYRGRLGHGVLACAGAGLSFLIAIIQHIALSISSETIVRHGYFTWIEAGNLTIEFALRLDPLSSVMCLVVAGVGFLIHVYSLGYMAEDRAYVRFFTYMNMFLAAMLLLVTASNLPLMFVGWEGVGLCSYLLIGFWHRKNSASTAGFKAFAVNRIGDAGFLIATFWCWKVFGTLEFHEMFARIGEASAADIRWITLLLFVGATGKSAQIPLYVWLPDAMEGPTPVSALIHAATMVTAGVYMIVRMNPLFHQPESVSVLIAWIGALTAIFSATIAIGQRDIKRVLAYSTVSQLGYMFLAVGIGAYVAAIFHLVTHAFFKACLFLGSGSVIHACHEEQDIMNMGGLKAKMKTTHWTFLVSTLAIAGVFPLAGFFSKDEILAYSFESSQALYIIGLAAAIMTAFYMGRLLFLTFYGGRRMNDEKWEKVHESPRTMTFALVVLGVLAVFGGLLGLPKNLGLPHVLYGYLEPLLPKVHGEHHMSAAVELGLMALSLALALGGLGVAASLFRRRGAEGEERLRGVLGPVHGALENKWYVDELYNTLIVSPLSKLARIVSDWFDPGIIDGAVHAIAGAVGLGSERQTRTQTGRIRDYVLVILTGTFLLVLCLVVLGR
ncbi:MAG: NADH-quinone oxidoreductase subunit L [Armatimonadia bacterium]|nr:NADH-quinone oxidoreductase subunit L [Armatimonadia bacterium]